MTGLSFQHGELYDAVTIPVDFTAVFFQCICNYIRLQNSRLFCIRSFIINLITPENVFPHRLSVEKHNRNVRLRRFVDDHSRIGAIHDIDQQKIIVQTDELIDLVVLLLLTAPCIGDLFADLHAWMIFFVLKNFILEITADLADINIFFVVYSHPDLDLLFAVLTLRCLCTSKDQHAQTKYCDGCLQFLF